MQSNELWTAEHAAQHWGVSVSRARGILSTRQIHRVSGNPAEHIRNVRLRQGARTDDEPTRLRVFFEFIRGAHETGVLADNLVVDEPIFTGDDRFDALLAATAEYLSARWGKPAPLWTTACDRFLHTAWWVADLPAARAFAMVWTPAPFLRHGIYLDRHDLMSDGIAVMPDPVFTRTELHRAFTALAERLARRNVVGQVHVVGGAAMLLAYDSRVTTRDIDALFSPDGPMLEAICEVADDMHWPRSWLKNQASSYVSRTPGSGNPVFDHPYLQVVATPPEHLLAMKVLAARGVRDRDDIVVLLDRLNVTTAEAVWDIVARYFPDQEIPGRSTLLIEDLLAESS